MPEVEPSPAGTEVLPVTQHRLNWKAVASWVQTAGASFAALVITVSQMQATVQPLIPTRYASIGALVFAAGKIMEAVQRQRDTARPRALVNFSVPAPGDKSESG